MAGAFLAIGLVLLAFALMNYLGNGDEASASPDSTLAPSVGAPLNVPAEASLTDPSDADPSLPAFGGSGGNGLGTDLKGLSGEGGTRNLPKIRIDVTITSKSPIGTVGYIVPSSTDDPTNTVTKVGTSWSRSFIGYGPPDYVQLFAAAGGTGNPVTCTVKINGRVTEQRSTDGPYGQLFCQG